MMAVSSSPAQGAEQDSSALEKVSRRPLLVEVHSRITEAYAGPLGADRIRLTFLRGYW